jgi:hypothetical protein
MFFKDVIFVSIGAYAILRVTGGTDEIPTRWFLTQTCQTDIKIGGKGEEREEDHHLTTEKRSSATAAATKSSQPS